MDIDYNHIAGQDLIRVAALSDGVFSIAMTLLIFNLHVPVSNAIHTEHALWTALQSLAPSILTYVMTFLTLGIFWVGQQTQLHQFAKSNRHLTWMMLVFLFGVSVTPFSTGLLAAFIRYRIALIIYWLNILFLGMSLLISRNYAKGAGLVKESIGSHEWQAVDRRIIISQSLYAFGALLCFFNTFLSIAVIITIQLHYVIAPRLPKLFRS